MKALKLILSFILLLLGVYCAMIVTSSENPIALVILIFAIVFVVLFYFIKRLKEFYDDSTLQL